MTGERVTSSMKYTIITEICNAIIYMTATRQLAIILAFVALWEIKFEQTVTVSRKMF